MVHSISFKRQDGSPVSIYVTPLTMSEVVKNSKLIAFLHEKKIFTTEDFLKKIPYKKMITELTGAKKHVRALTQLYDKLSAGFIYKSYQRKVKALLKTLRDLNLRLTENDRSIISTCIVFKNVIIDKWQFLKKCLSKKTKRRITTREHKWEIIFQEYIN